MRPQTIHRRAWPQYISRRLRLTRNVVRLQRNTDGCLLSVSAFLFWKKNYVPSSNRLKNWKVKRNFTCPLRHSISCRVYFCRKFRPIQMDLYVAVLCPVEMPWQKRSRDQWDQKRRLKNRWMQWFTMLGRSGIACFDLCVGSNWYLLEEGSSWRTTRHRTKMPIFGSQPSDHYFRSVCLFVCLFVQSFSQPSLIRFRSN